jgi:hypothetical protein
MGNTEPIVFGCVSLLLRKEMRLQMANPGTTNFQVWNPNQTNQETDIQYAADQQRSSGAPSGTIFPATTANKLFYQVTTMVTALAQAIASKGYSPTDSSLTILTEILQQLAMAVDIQTEDFTYAVDQGQPNVYLLLLNPPITSYQDGQVVQFKTSHNNTSGSCTLDAGGGAKPIRDKAGNVLSPNAIQGTVTMIFNSSIISGGAWILQTGITPDQIQTEAFTYATDSGSTNNYVVALTPPITTSYQDGQVVQFKTNNPNTGVSALNAGSGPKPIVDRFGNAIGPNSVLGTSTVIFNSSIISGGAWVLNTGITPAQIQTEAFTYASDSGSVNAYSVTLNPAITTQDGLVVQFKTSNPNTSACTLNAGSGAKPIVDRFGNALVPNSITGTSTVIFNSTITSGGAWVLQSDYGSNWKTQYSGNVTVGPYDTYKIYMANTNIGVTYGLTSSYPPNFINILQATYGYMQININSADRINSQGAGQGIIIPVGGMAIVTTNNAGYWFISIITTLHGVWAVGPGTYNYTFPSTRVKVRIWGAGGGGSGPAGGSPGGAGGGGGYSEGWVDLSPGQVVNVVIGSGGSGSAGSGGNGGSSSFGGYMGAYGGAGAAQGGFGGAGGGSWGGWLNLSGSYGEDIPGESVLGSNWYATGGSAPMSCSGGVGGNNVAQIPGAGGGAYATIDGAGNVSGTGYWGAGGLTIAEW